MVDINVFVWGLNYNINEKDAFNLKRDFKLTGPATLDPEKKLEVRINVFCPLDVYYREDGEFQYIKVYVEIPDTMAAHPRLDNLREVFITSTKRILPSSRPQLEFLYSNSCNLKIFGGNQPMKSPGS